MIGWQGSAALFGPIVVTSSDNQIYIDDTLGEGAATSVTIDADTYESIEELASDLQSAIRTAMSDTAYCVDVLADDGGRVKIYHSDSSAFDIGLAGGNNMGSHIGFTSDDFSGGGASSWTGNTIPENTLITDGVTSDSGIRDTYTGRPYVTMNGEALGWREAVKRTRKISWTLLDSTMYQRLIDIWDVYDTVDMMTYPLIFFSGYQYDDWRGQDNLIIIDESLHGSYVRGDAPGYRKVTLSFASFPKTAVTT